MTNLSDTATEAGQIEASVMLLRLMGELSECTCGELGCTVGLKLDSKHGWFVPKVKNLYDPANMALAWRVLNWAATQTVTVKAQKGGGDDIWQEPWTTFIDDEINGKYELYRMPPADAQRAWLDKILSLAIRAGMVQESLDAILGIMDVAAKNTAEIMPCGHTRADIVSSDEGTAFCGQCVLDEAEAKE